MADEDQGGKQDQLEEHSLPGTNQAGKGPSSCEKNDRAAMLTSTSGTAPR
jgi:hypothetical protein